MNDKPQVLFVYSLNGAIKCLTCEEAIQLQSAMLSIGWHHTATIHPARWIENLANSGIDPSELLGELQFSNLTK